MKCVFFSSLLAFLSPLLFIGSYAQQPEAKTVDSSAYYSDLLMDLQGGNDFNRAIHFFERNYEKNLSESKPVAAALNLEVLANTEYKIGDYNSSESLSVEALKLLDLENDADTQVIKTRIYNLLGLLYANLENYEKSKTYYGRSLQLAKTTSDSLYVLINMSAVLRAEKNYETAIDTLNYALNRANTPRYTRLAGDLLDNLGYTELLAQEEESLMHLKQSLAIRLQLHDTLGIFSNYRNLSSYYKQVPDTLTAIDYARKAYSLSKYIPDPAYELEALGLIADLDTLEYIERFKYLSDSLKESALTRQNKYAALKYDVAREQRQTQLALLERDREKRLKTIYVLTLVLGVVVILGFSVLSHFKQKQKQLDAIRKTEASISKKVHDGLANDTFQVISELQNLENIPDHILAKLDKIYLETRDISKNHSPLIDGNNFKDQLVSRLSSYKSENFNVITRNLNGIDWEKFSKNKKDAIYMVLGELMTNTKKHSKASLALISFEEKGKKLQITFKDNGLGNEIKKGNGIQNMEFRIFSLNGTISFEPEPGKGLKVQILV
ncbi:tetratricopeptide repeat-containing sensor histidine kinase [Leeuwenhoekiella sp. H156]|uniref:tetratricopeptide repeat-containing sensor histidine kinase n=1 Tax=Leeuwenhoekiella sp. H156 TaxID=3450128 RepID=UPI003FA43B59